jgi:GLPGLI family protein
MNAYKVFAPLTLASLLLCSGCGHDLLKRKVSEGIIEYALSFPEYDPIGLMANMLPEKTTLTFAPGKQVAELSAGMGVFRTCMVADNDQKLLDYHLSVMSKRLVANMGPRDLHLFNDDFQPITILYTAQTDTVAGYPCKKAVAVFPGLDQPEVELWYTDMIDVKDPNWFGPYSEIPGILLRYEVVQYGMRMRLDATAVQAGPVDPSKFASKPDHQAVSPEVLHREFKEVLSTFTM